MRTTRSKLSQFVHSVLHMPRYSVARVAIPVALGLAVAFQTGPSIAAFATENHVLATVSDTLAATTAALTGSAANPENQSGAGTSATAGAVTNSEATVTTAAELQAAIDQVNKLADGSIYTIKLKGQPAADGSGNTLDLGGFTYTFAGNKSVTIEDAGTKVSIIRTTDDQHTPLIQVDNGASLTVTTSTASDDLLSYSSQKAPFLRVLKGSTATIAHGTFSGNEADYGPVLQNGYEYYTPTKTWTGGNKPTGYEDAWTVEWHHGGKATISGGVYQGNKATASYFGGGVIYSYAADGSSGVTISGGLFKGNSSSADGVYRAGEKNLDPFNHLRGASGTHGGGVLYSRQGYVTVTGGQFLGNTADGMNYDGSPRNNYGGGGGVLYVANESKGNEKSTLTISGGTFGGANAGDGNVSTGSGGAIFVAWYVDVKILAASFVNNSCVGMGGAIYSEDTSTVEYGASAAWDNHAGHFGGGLWLCPSGMGITSKTGNIALFDNTANPSFDQRNDTKGFNGAAGDDFALMYPVKKEVPSNSYLLSNNWFNGVPSVKWYEDGQPNYRATGFGDFVDSAFGSTTLQDSFWTNNVSRYADASNPKLYKEQNIVLTRHMPANDDVDHGVSLKAVVNPGVDVDFVKQNAKVTFTGNVAQMSGGAIGTDGRVAFGDIAHFSFTKVDVTQKDSKDNPIPLGGAKFTLYRLKDGEEDDFKLITPDNTSVWEYFGNAVSNDGSTNNKGLVWFDGLSTGTYRLVETSAPSGYITPSIQWTVSVEWDEKDDIPKAKVISVVGSPSDSSPNFSENADGSLTLSNTPDSGPAKQSIKVNKDFMQLDGDKLVPGTPDGVLWDGEFQFTLQPWEVQYPDGSEDKLENIPMPDGTDSKDGVILKTVKNDKGSVDFGEISFPAEGTYTYLIKEVGGSGAANKWTISSKEIKATIKVTRDKDGNLVAGNPTYEDNFPEASNGDPFMNDKDDTFTNVYSPAPANIGVNIHKSVSGDGVPDLKNLEGKFHFKIVPYGNGEGKDDFRYYPKFSNADNATNGADGLVSFGDANFWKEGTYTYEISEWMISGNEDGHWSLSDTKVYVTIQVTSDGKGGLQASATYKVNGDETGAASITNTYIRTPVQVHAEMTKAVTGNLAPNVSSLDGKFHFKLESMNQKDDAPSFSNGNDAKNDQSGHVDFGTASFSKPGTYVY